TRGPLVGIPADSGVRVFETTTLHVAFTTAYVHASLGHVRLGQKEAAYRSLMSLPPTTDSADAESRLRHQLLWFVFDERFRPWYARRDELWLRWQLNPGVLAGLGQYARFGNFFDVPGAQEFVGRMLSQYSRDRAAGATGHTAEGLAFMLTARPGAGLAQLDSAVVLHQTGEAQLQQAEWRVLLPSLELGHVAQAEVAEARHRLMGVTGPG